MDPCPFARLIVESLALKLPPATSKPAGSGVHPSTTPCFCTLNLQSPASPSSSQTAPLLLSSDTETAAPSATSSSPVIFNLDPSTLLRLVGKPASLTVSVYAGRNGSTCGVSSARLLGRVSVGVKFEEAATWPLVMQNGWVSIGKQAAAAARLYLVVRSEPDPRYVFQFGGEPECSPVVYQVIHGNGNNCSNVRQPVFSCRFSAERRSTRSSSLPPDRSSSTNSSRCFGSFGTERDSLRDQRKGWTVTIHDLSGSPVAAASMITPFVPSPGSDRVSRSNPGAWLILQPTGFSTNSWKPWGRLEAWRDIRRQSDYLGYKFELVMDPGPNSSIPIAESTLSVRRGGQFCIDPAVVEDAISRSWPFLGGFVMGSTVEGEGKVSKPTVQIGVQHVRCMSDAALFVALSAAIDLSMDACSLFSRKLRKELCHDQQEYGS